jgi:outer membrane protein TolC
MRWKTVLGGGLAFILAASAGCKQACYLTECDVDRYVHGSGVPSHLETDSHLGVVPSASSITPQPATVHDPERPIRYLPLAEAISIALQQGNTGDPGLTGQTGDPGLLPTAQGAAITNNIRVFALDQAIAGVNIDRALTRFDAAWGTSLLWNNTDRPVGTPLDTFQAGNQINAIRTEAATFTTGIVKPLPTGGTTGITFSVPYQITNLPSRVNPSYQPSVQVAFEQPLLQGFGVEINQIRARHPGSSFVDQTGLIAGSQQNNDTEGILITRLRYDQARAEFERLVQQMVANVEVAYWNLYGSYWNLYSQEAALRQAFTAWRILQQRFQAGKNSTGEVAQARGQYELFRSNRIDALNAVLTNERQLRGLLNLPVEDGTRLVPADAPTLAPYQPDWLSANNEALALRPELIILRNELKARQFAVIEAKNELMPDLRFRASYDVNSIGTRLDGADGQNAFRNLASDHFNNWQAGLTFTMPLGFRLAHGNVRRAKLALERSFLQLDETEKRVARILEDDYRDLFRWHDQIGANRSQREAYGEQLRARFEELLAGKVTVDVLLEAQRFWASALSAEYNAVSQYNATLAKFQHAKGTILIYDNVQIQEGALPECARERAVENKRQKDRALILCERADAGAYKKCGGAACGCATADSKAKSATLEGVFEGMPPVGADVPNALPQTEDARKPEKKLEESKADDKSLPVTYAPVTPGSTVAPEEKPVQTLPPPPPERSLPKLDEGKAPTALPPPLPPPPMNNSGAPNN